MNDHGLWTPSKSFLSKISNFVPGQAFWLKFFEAFGVFSAGLSAPVWALSVPCPHYQN